MVVSNVAVGYFQRVIRDIREAGRKRAKRSRSKLYTQKYGFGEKAMSSGAVGGGRTMERGFCLKMLKRAAVNTTGNVSYFLQNSKSLVLSETQSD